MLKKAKIVHSTCLLAEYDLKLKLKWFSYIYRQGMLLFH